MVHENCLITGTNGKTTTNNLANHIFKGKDYDIVYNLNGSNMITGDVYKRQKEKLCEDIQSVGVFVDAGTDDILKLYNDGIIDVAQLHGMESEDYSKTLKEKTDYKWKIIKAIEVSENTDLSKYDDSLADYLLLDSGKGSGKTFDSVSYTHLCM